ncbi:ly6/PLAUR domain-containing protein 1 [Brachyhypopomus gauderio]|uniref:ly6/PLAUR domain-containing protein 1 n=1 Tax=Brachyhypopomus gauderio TaxID=698409 RepID=UPI00404104BD
MQLLLCACLLAALLGAGAALQIQCYQCEEIQQDDCSSPEFIVNCTVNVQDMCQKEVLVMEDGIHYRKSCASSGACLIASSGYQQFCTGKLNSVCITCCSTPLCNGPRHKRRPPASEAPPLSPLTLSSLLYSLVSISVSLPVSLSFFL